VNEHQKQGFLVAAFSYSHIITKLSKLINIPAAGASRARIPTHMDSIRLTMYSQPATKDEPQLPEEVNVVVTGFRVSALPTFLKSSFIFNNDDCLG
jgi:hypothetical protein